MGTVPTFTTGTPAIQSDLEWWINARPLAYLYQTSAQTVTSGSWVPVQMNTALIDRDGGWPGGTSGRYTIGLTLGAGGATTVYQISACVAFAGTGGTYRAAKFVLTNGSGTADVAGSVVQVSASAAASVVIPPVLVEATGVSDYVELQCMHDASPSIALAMSGGQQSQMLVTFEGTLT